MMVLFITIGAIIALISPLLTFCAYAQQKEWRFDRIRVALKEEGVLQTLIGNTRGVIAILYSIAFIAPYITEQAVLAIAIGALVSIGIIQITTKRQRLPKFTSKAKAVTTVAALLNIGVLLILYVLQLIISPLVVLLVLLQPITIAASICILLPLDSYLKKKTYTKARRLRATLLHTPVIAITGSVGKSTCKHILAQLLSGTDALVVPKFINTELGVCNWFIAAMQKRSSAPSCLVVEMGAYRQGEIALMCSIFAPTISIVTHIGTQHIALFGSQQQLLDAKAEILEAVPTDGNTLFPGDQWYSEQLANKCKGIITTVGQTNSVDAQATQLTETKTGLQFIYNNNNYTAPIQGAHNINTILLAMSAAKICGITKEAIHASLQNLTLPSSTFTTQAIGSRILVDDTHNSSPTSFKAAIEWAKQQEAPYKVLIASGLIEQGKQRKAVHQKLGRACKGVFNECICTNAKAAKELQSGFGSTISTLKQHTLQFPEGTIIVCEGKMPFKHILERIQASS